MDERVWISINIQVTREVHIELLYCVFYYLLHIKLLYCVLLFSHYSSCVVVTDMLHKNVKMARAPSLPVRLRKPLEANCI